MTENNLSLHYKVLKQFLDISDDSTTRSKSNTTRAVRAREKLLKLSMAQFRELSTDVYDELKRRIDESNGEPDFLLPKSTFHPKRNQARQKLSSLPQSRFKDLVSDISYEIERREIHVAKTSASPIKSTSNSSITQASPQKSIPSHDLPIDESHEDSPASHNGANNSQTIGIQPKTVIPNKANLTWSSDEEDAGDETDHAGDHDEKPMQRELNHDLNGSGTAKHLSDDRSDIINELQQKLQSLQTDHTLLQSNYATLQQKHSEVSNAHDSLKNQLDSLNSEKKSWAINQSDISTKEFDNLKAANAALRLENQSLKNSNTTTSKELLRSSTYSRDGSNYMHLSHSPTESPVHHKLDLKKQLEQFYDKLDHLDKPIPSSTTKSDEVSQLKNDVLKWQKLYEESRANTIYNDLSKLPLANSNLKSFISSSGLISIKEVSDLQSLVESILTYINNPTFDADILFEKISKISVLANQIASQGDSNLMNSNGNSVCLRESASHALTATRYYAVYSSILPKIVVQRAISEISYTLCDLISVSKLKYSSAEDNPGDATLVNNTGVHDSDTKIDASAVEVRPFKTVHKLKEFSNKPIDDAVTRGIHDSEPQVPPRVQSQIPPRVESQRVNPTQKETSTHQPAAQLYEQKNDQIPSFQNEKSIVDNLNLNSPTQTNSVSSPSKNVTISPNQPQANSSSVKSLASRFDQSKSDSNNSPRSRSNNVESPSSNKSSPSSRGIFDRVKQFESPTETTFKNKYNASRELAQKSPAKSIASKTTLFDDANNQNSTVSDGKEVDKQELHTLSLNRNVLNSSQNERGLSDPFNPTKKEEQVEENEDEEPTQVGVLGVPAFGAAAAAGAAVAAKTPAAAKPRGILQTLKNRFNYEQETPEKEPVDSDSDKAETSTEMTPARSLGNDDIGVHDSEETSPEEKNVGGFFNSVKNRFVSTGTKDEKEHVKELTPSNSDLNISRSAEDVAFKSAESSPLKASTAAANVPVVQAGTTKNVGFAQQEDDDDDEEYSEEDSEEAEARQRQEYRKSMAAATFNIDLFDIDDPDNTLTHVLLYLEHQTVQVISTIQSLLSAIKKPDASRGELREKSKAITVVISQMSEATKTSMNQTRNFQLKEHGSWVVTSLEDCNHRMNVLCKPNAEKNDEDFADKNFKQRLAGISFDIAKCTKELVKTVEEASLKEEITKLNARLSHGDDLT